MRARMPARAGPLLLAAAALLGLLGLARCQGTQAAARASDRAAIAALQDTVTTARAQLHRERTTRDSLIRLARAATAPHVAAQAATDRAAARARAASAAARTAAADSALTLAAARAQLVVLADRIGSLEFARTAERRAAADRIERLTITITYVEQTTPTVDHLVAAQDRLIRAALRRRPWWQRALGDVCTAGLTGSGGGGGALVGGPAGAAIGAVVGYASGRLACP